MSTTRLIATIATALALPAAAATQPAAERTCRIDTDAKGARVAKCAPANAKSEAKAKKPDTTAASVDCRTVTKAADKLLCLAAQQGAPEPDAPSPGNEIG
jgi:hypothetical protein